MHPAWSVLLLTTLIGAAQGLFLALFTVQSYSVFGLLPAAFSTRIGAQTQRPLAIVMIVLLVVLTVGWVLLAVFGALHRQHAAFPGRVDQDLVDPGDQGVLGQLPVLRVSQPSFGLIEPAADAQLVGVSSLVAMSALLTTIAAGTLLPCARNGSAVTVISSE